MDSSTAAIIERDISMCIIFNNISKSFDNTKVFQDFNLVIKGNQTTCILGASGIGKTTLLNLLLGIEKVDCGSIDGLDCKNIVAVFQENRLVENLTSIKNVQLVCKKNFSKVELMDDFKKVGLQGVEDKLVSELSGGMKRRVAIIRAVFVDSDIVVMDEPFKGLDVELKSKIIEYVREKTLGKTVIIVTHSLDEVEELKANKIELNFTKNNHSVIINEY